MPWTFRLFSIRHTTNNHITLMDGNLNIIQGDLHHDRSTTITNMNALNIESSVTEQQSPPTTSLIVDDAPTTMISLDPFTGTAHLEHDTDSTSDTRRSRPVEMISRPMEMISRPVDMTTSVHDTVKTSHFDVDERQPLCTTAPTKKNGFKSVFKKVKRWIKRKLRYRDNVVRFGVQDVGIYNLRNKKSN